MPPRRTGGLSGATLVGGGKTIPTPYKGNYNIGFNDGHAPPATWNVPAPPGPQLIRNEMARSFGVGFGSESLTTPEAHPINQLTIPYNAVLPWTVKRPTLLIPIDAPVGGFISYCPTRIVAAGAAGGVPSATELQRWQRSFSYGIVYMPTPGTWYLYQTGSTGGCRMIVVDVSDPGILGTYINEDGHHNIAPTQVTSPSGGGGTSTTLVNASPSRKSIIIQNQELAAGVQVRLMPGNAGNIVAGDGFMLLTGQDMYKFDGPFCVKDRLHIKSATAFTCTVNVWEYY